jgi:D-lactate dehydrogenase (cytochrome)
VGKLLSSGIEPRCVELLDTTCISAVNNSLNTKSIPAFPLKPHLFFKLSGSANVIPQQQKQLVSVLKAAGGTQLRIAKTEKEGEQLWDIRKSLVYSLVTMFPGSEVISTDVCVPTSRLAGLIEQYKLDQEKINKEIENDAGVVVGEVKKLESLIIGHVGDGNFHSLMYVPLSLLVGLSLID